MLKNQRYSKFGLAAATVAVMVSASCTNLALLNRSPQMCDRYCQLKALPDIAIGYAAVGQQERAQQLLSQAFQSAKSIYAQTGSASDLGKIAIGYAHIGEYDTALHYIEKMGANYGTDSAILVPLHRIIYEAIQAGDYDEAIQLSRRLSFGTTVWTEDGGEYNKAKVFSDIADSAVRSLDSELSEEILDQLWSVADALPAASPQTPSAQIAVGARLAVDYSKIMRSQKADQLLAQIERISDKNKDFLPYSNEIEVAQSYGLSGQREKAAERLDRLYQKVSESPSYLPRDFPDELLLDITKVYAQIGERKKATAIVNRMAKTISDKSVSPDSRLEGVDTLASAYIAMDEFDKASQTINLKYQWYPRTEAQVSSIGGLYPSWRMPETSLAVVYAKLGEYQKASDVAKIARYETQRTDAFKKIAAVYAEKREFEQALETMDLIENPSSESVRADLQANVIIAVSSQSAEVEPVAQAVKVLDAALQRAASINVPEQKIKVLSALSTQYAAVGQPDKAVDLLQQSLNLIGN